MNCIYSSDGFSITAEPGVPLNCTCVIFNQCILVSFTHHMGLPDSLSCGFFHPYQIVLTLFNIIIEFTRVNSVDLYTFEGTNPNFRVGQLFIFVKNQNVFFVRFKQNYIIKKNLLILIVQHCSGSRSPEDHRIRSDSQAAQLAAAREENLLNLTVERVSDDFLTLNLSAPRI